MNIKDDDLRPIYILQDLEMFVVGNNVFCIGSHGTIHKLIIICILSYQPEVDIGFLIDRCT